MGSFTQQYGRLIMSDPNTVTVENISDFAPKTAPSIYFEEYVDKNGRKGKSLAVAIDGERIKGNRGGSVARPTWYGLAALVARFVANPEEGARFVEFMRQQQIAGMAATNGTNRNVSEANW
jgi:hypothetical protein